MKKLINKIGIVTILFSFAIFSICGNHNIKASFENNGFDSKGVYLNTNTVNDNKTYIQFFAEENFVSYSVVYYYENINNPGFFIVDNEGHTTNYTVENYVEGMLTNPLVESNKISHKLSTHEEHISARFLPINEDGNTVASVYFTLKKFPVTFDYDLQGVTNPVVVQTYGQQIVVPNLLPEEYNLVGWFDDQNQEVLLTDIVDETISSILTAKIRFATPIQEPTNGMFYDENATQVWMTTLPGYEYLFLPKDEEITDAHIWTAGSTGSKITDRIVTKTGLTSYTEYAFHMRKPASGNIQASEIVTDYTMTDYTRNRIESYQILDEKIIVKGFLRHYENRPVEYILKDASNNILRGEVIDGETHFITAPGQNYTIYFEKDEVDFTTGVFVTTTKETKVTQLSTGTTIPTITSGLYYFVDAINGVDDATHGSRALPYQSLNYATKQAKTKGIIVLLSDVELFADDNNGMRFNKELTFTSDNIDEPYSIIRTGMGEKYSISIPNEDVNFKLTLKNITIDGKNLVSNTFFIYMTEGVLNIEEGTTIKNFIYTGTNYSVIYGISQVTFNIKGGLITDNESVTSIIELRNDNCHLNMTGGIITNNKSNEQTIYKFGTGSMQLLGGTITGNESGLATVHYPGSYQVVIGGDMQIHSNTTTDASIMPNLLLESSNITIKEEFSGKIYLRHASKKTKGTIFGTTASTGNPKVTGELINSDNNELYGYLDSAKKLYWDYLYGEYSVTTEPTRTTTGLITGYALIDPSNTRTVVLPKLTANDYHIMLDVETDVFTYELKDQSNGIFMINYFDQELHDAKLAAKAEINALIAGYLEDDYSQDNWEDILTKQQETLETILNATTVAEVNTAKQAGLTTIKAVGRLAYYVHATEGNDNNDGSRLSPLKTLAKAFTVAVNDSTIILLSDVDMGTTMTVNKKLLITSDTSEVIYTIKRTVATTYFDLSDANSNLTFKDVTIDGNKTSTSIGKIIQMSNGVLNILDGTTI